LLLLFAIPAFFVGNQACEPCHASIVKAYSATPMAISSGRNRSPVTPGTFRHAVSGVRYDISDSGLVRFSKGGARGERQLDYYIGSGAAGRSFLYARDGFLFEAPVTWYTQAGKWDVSPGYERDGVSRWNRAVEPSCLACHASQTRWREGSQNQYGDPPFTQDGVGCERCHGPGSLHIEGKGKMVNPAKLEPSRRDSVCTQCHLSGDARVERAGRKFADYRPGDVLSDFVAYFVATGPGDLQVNSHVEKLSKSVCKRAAGDRLWCGTCHDPHQVPAAAERAGWFRAKCLTCHESTVCERGFDCVSCHMPKSSAADAGHGVFTDHSIPRVASRTRVKTAPSWQPAGFSAADSGARELGLAYADAGARSGDRRQQAEAIRLLTGVPEDVEVQVRLGDLLERAGSADRAIALYRSALRKDPNAVAALVNLGRLYGSQGHLDEAIALWREALKQNPCLFEAGANLQVALRAKNDVSGADAVKRAQGLCVFE
jgi:hypothetical protein